MTAKKGVAVVVEKPLVFQEQPAFSAESLIAMAIEKGTSVDVMERLLAIRKELKTERAKEAFDLDMAAFQGACPTIQKTKEVKTKTGQVAYRYAPIESIVAQVKEQLKEYGFSYATKTETGEKNVKSTCIVKHRGGHQEESSVEVPLGGQTNIMSASQVVAAALTFAKRYAFCNAFGILTGDEDNDTAPARSDQAEEPHPSHTPEAKKSLDNALARASLLVQIKKEGQRLGISRETLEAKIGKKLGDLGVSGLEQVWEQLKVKPTPGNTDDRIPTIGEDGVARYDDEDEEEPAQL